MLHLISADIWIDNIYMRILQSPNGLSDVPFLIEEGTALLMTRATLQGSGTAAEKCSVCAMSVPRGATVVAEGML